MINVIHEVPTITRGGNFCTNILLFAAILPYKVRYVLKIMSVRGTDTAGC